jgi:hypothetical protein
MAAGLERPPSENEKRRPTGIERRNLKNSSNVGKITRPERHRQAPRPTATQIRIASRLFAPNRWGQK